MLSMHVTTYPDGVRVTVRRWSAGGKYPEPLLEHTEVCDASEQSGRESLALACRLVLEWLEGGAERPSVRRDR